MTLLSNYNFYNEYFALFYDPNLVFSSLTYFQVLGYYIIIMSIFSSVIGVFDINKGGSPILATLNAKNATISVLLQAIFCLVVFFISNTKNFSFTDSVNFSESFFSFDSYILITSIIICICGVLILSLSSNYILQTEKDTLEFPIFISFSIAFMIFFVSATNLISVFISLEGLSFILYVLAALNFTSHASIEAAIKYFCLGGLSSGVLIFGISMLYGASGSLNFLELRDFFLANSELAQIDSSTFLSGSSSHVIYNILLAIFFGFFFKMSAFPCHVWTPDVYEGAPLIVTAFFSIVVKFTVFIFFLRFSNLVLFSMPFIGNFVLYISALGSLWVGAFGALGQTKIKRFIAYTSINQVGFLLIGFVCGTFNGSWSMVLHLLMYVIMSFGLFAFLLSVSSFFDTNSLVYLSDLNNFGKKSPISAFLLSIVLFSMAGIPPLGGFFGKYYLLLSAIESSKYILVIIALLINVVSTFYYIRIVKHLWFGAKEENNRFFFDSSVNYTFILGVTSFILIISILILPQIIELCLFITTTSMNPFI